jgi:hypothetical protein
LPEKKAVSKRKSAATRGVIASPKPLAIAIPSDLALEALATIQALDAEPVAQAFRDKWLDGAKFSDEAAAVAWMQSVAGAPFPLEVVFRIPVSNDEARQRAQAEIGKSNEERAALRESWARDLLREHEAALVSRYMLTPVPETIRFAEAESAGGEVHQFWADERTALADLATTVQGLVKTYRWDEQQAMRFVLGAANQIAIPAMRVQVRSELRIGATRDRTPAASPYLSEIVLRCRPQVTKKQVADAYDQARRSLLLESGIEPGERNRATTSERTRDLAVLAFRIHLDTFASWRAAFDAYALESPGDASEYQPKYGGPVRIGTFRRDVRNAYERVTGWELVWRPDLREPGSGGTHYPDDEE